MVIRIKETLLSFNFKEQENVKITLYWKQARTIKFE